jgi:hypothetical protein
VLLDADQLKLVDSVLFSTLWGNLSLKRPRTLNIIILR